MSRWQRAALLPRSVDRMRVALGRPVRLAGGTLTVFPSDVFLVSYPRSGNTWFRFLVANTLHPETEVSFASIPRLVPDIYDVPDSALLRAPDPRVLKSHEPYDGRYRRVVSIVRDPADVAVSYLHYLVKTRVLDDDHDVEDFVDRFLAGELDGFGTWGEHVHGWRAARDGDEDFVLLRYEDAIADPAEALRRILSLLGVEADPARIDAAVARSSATELRRLERETGSGLPALRGSREDRDFVRRARPGGADEEWPKTPVARIRTAWPEVAEPLGYGPQRSVSKGEIG
jgi:hypothetical protein